MRRTLIIMSLLNMGFGLIGLKSEAEEFSVTLTFSLPESLKRANDSLFAGDDVSAAHYYEKALEDGLSSDNSYIARTNYCVALTNLNAFYKAIQQCEIAIDLRPFSWRGYNNLGVTYHRLGLYREAIDLFEEAQKYVPENYKIGKNITASREALSLATSSRHKRVMWDVDRV